MSDYYCPHCGADLEDQFGFDPNAGYWTCTECGQFLIDPEDSDDSSRFDGVGWFCDGCGAYLNKQFGFNDWYDTWICTECGHTNNLSEDEIYESEKDYQNSQSGGSLVDSFLNLANAGLNLYAASKGVSLEEDDDESYYDSEAYRQLREEQARQRAEEETRAAEERRLKSEERKAKRKKFWGTITRKKVSPSLMAIQCHGMKYEDVVNAFKEKEFYNITTVKSEDLPIDRIGEEGLVDIVRIDGSSDFDITSVYYFGAKIEIVYHTLKRITLPFTSRTAKNRNVDDVIQSFYSEGFVNVEKQPIADLTTGWIIKDGAVESISVDDRTDYKKGDKYRLDSCITVSYHTFKRKS